MRKLKFFMAIAMIAGMFACQNELEQEVKIPEVEKPDVYAENGYLVFKDYNAADSVLKIVSKYSKMEYDAWQSELGFKSARSYAQKFNDEYDAIETLEDWYTFKGKYETTLNIVETEDEVNVDFPFENEPWNPILNAEGVVKVGKSLILFEKEATKSILDGDVNKLEIARKLNVSDEGRKIQVFGRNNVMKAGGILKDYYHGNIVTWGDFKNTTKRRGVKSRLEYRQFSYWVGDQGDPNTHIFEMITQYFIVQEGLKYSWGKWRSYNTIYHIKDIEMYSSRGGYAYKYDFISSMEAKKVFFCFYYTIDVTTHQGEGYPNATTSNFDSNLKIAFKQNTRGIGEWISSYVKKDNTVQDYCYPLDWTYWKTNDFSSFGEYMYGVEYKEYLPSL